MLVLLLTLAAGAQSSWDVGPKPGFKGHRLTLTASMDKALRQAHPTFRLWKRAEFLPEIAEHSAHPFALLADFNGDGRTDAAVHGRTDRNCVVAVVLSGTSGYKVHDVNKTPYTKDSLYAGLTDGKERWGVKTLLEPVKPGKYEFIEGPPLTLKLPAFEYSIFQTGALLYYWDGKRFKERNAGC
jgi:hypothetical protein